MEQVWGADSKVKILRSLAQAGFPQLDAAQLAAETGLSPAGVRKTLRELAATGIVQPVARGRTTYYVLNADHSLARSILDAFRIEASVQGIEHLGPTFWNHLVPVVDKISSRAGVLFVLLHGSIIRPPVYPSADVDLLVGLDASAPGTRDGRSERGRVSDMRMDTVDLEATDESVLGHNVHVLAMDAREFEARVQANDGFAANVLARHVVLYMDANYHFPWARSAQADRAPAKSWGGAWRSWGNRGGV